METIEQLLQGNKAGTALLSQMYTKILHEFEPVGDAFAPVQYRTKTAANVVAAQLWKVMKQYEPEGGGGYAAES
ncbi:hypothetical protein [Paenibacillus protaetiae]|nr:hypothetical protein [Paenibacillus protaetiae]